MPTLENWSVITTPSNPFQASELWPSRLSGRIYNDTRFEDGSLVATSTLKSIDVKARTASTKNTEYILGEPDSTYVEYCKNNNIEL